MLTIRPAMLQDADRIQTIAIDAQMFSEQKAPFLGNMLAQAVAGEQEGAHWLVAHDETQRILGAAYYAPEPFANSTAPTITKSSSGSRCFPRSNHDVLP